MLMKKIYLLIFLLSFFLYNIKTFAQVSANQMNKQQLKLFREHVYGGQPDTNKLLVRNAYVTSYNNEFRIPNWSAYHITIDYLKTPRRIGKFAKFRPDPNVSDPVTTKEYIGLFNSLGYARGHLAPYKIMGGDRDHDGKYASLIDTISDPDDELTVYQGNYLSNIAPQLHKNFNGSGGLWYKTEQLVRNIVNYDSIDLWVFSGCVILNIRSPRKVGNVENITVPDMFYKLIIKDNDGEFPSVLAFLFPHFDTGLDITEKDIFKYLVTVDYIEAITGMDFFNEFMPTVQDSCEKIIDIKSWDSNVK